MCKTHTKPFCSNRIGKEIGVSPLNKWEHETNCLVSSLLQPFRVNYPVNPSWEIARRLPEYLPPLQGKNPNAADPNAAPLPPVRIVVHPEAIRVNYKTIRALNPSFWEDEYDGHKIDAVIHIGMTGRRLHYVLESRAHRTGYKTKDVDGETLEDENEGMHGEDWVWYGLPDELPSDLDISDVHRRWAGHSSVSRLYFAFVSSFQTS